MISLMPESALPRVPISRQFVALMRCGSCRFAAFYFLSFQTALVDAGITALGWAIFGFFFWFAHSLGVELVNRYSDRREDRVNRPERTALCEQIGFPVIRKLAICIWGGLAAVYCAWLCVEPNRTLGILLWAGLFAGLCYSVLIRFKTKRFLSLLTLTFPFGGPFLIGWAAAHLWQAQSLLLHDLFFRLGPFLLPVGLFIVAHAGTKDLTDIAGDEEIGYSSLWVGMIRRNRVALIVSMVSSSFIATAVFVLVGALPPRFSLQLFLWPASVVLAFASVRSCTSAQRAAVRETLYHYWFGFICVNCLLLVPGFEMLSRIIFASIYWVAASQCLHWNNGLEREQLLSVASLSLSRLKAQPGGAGTLPFEGVSK